MFKRVRALIGLLCIVMVWGTLAGADTLPSHRECLNWLDSRAQKEFLAQNYPEYPELLKDYQASLSLISADEQSRPVLSIVVPAYREERRLPQSLDKIKAFFNAFPFPVEVLVRIEKSPDRTAEVAMQETADDARFAIYPHPVQRGKGYAVRQGVLDAKGDYILFMDADLSTPLPEIFHFLAAAKTHPQQAILICDRHHPDSQISQKQSLRRQLMGSVFRTLTTKTVSLFGLKGIFDTQCGFKMFRRNAAETIFRQAQTDGFAFDVELLLLASRYGYSVQSLPVQWKDDERSTVNPLLDPPKMLLDMVKIQFKISKRLGMRAPKLSQTSGGL